MNAITLAIVDDESLWLDLLRVALTSSDMHVSAAYSDPAVALAEWPRVDVALLDVELGPDRMHGFELARQLRQRDPRLAVVFLTSVADPWMIDHTAASAVAGTSYLLKSGVGNLAMLQHAVFAAARGEIMMDAGILDAIRDNGPVAGLTPLQGRLLRLLATGSTNQQIAIELGVAQKTVEANITKVARILEVGDDENVRVGCVTRYLAAAADGPHRAMRHGTASDR